MRQLLHHHIGVRAEGMILVGIIWALIGTGVLVGATPQYSGVWHATLPTPLVVGMWLTPAAVAMCTAASARWSPLGLGLLTIPPVVTMCSYLTAWIIALVPGPPEGDTGGWYRASIYAAMVALVMLLSHIPATVRAPLTGRSR